MLRSLLEWRNFRAKRIIWALPFPSQTWVHLGMGKENYYFFPPGEFHGTMPLTSQENQEQLLISTSTSNTKQFNKPGLCQGLGPPGNRDVSGSSSPRTSPSSCLSAHTTPTGNIPLGCKGPSVGTRPRWHHCQTASAKKMSSGWFHHKDWTNR